MNLQSSEGFDELREAVRALCATFPPEYWRQLDVERAYPETFVRALTEKLMMYALGRSVQHTDMPLVRKIVRDAAPGGYKFSAIVKGIVDSAPFQRAQLKQGE